MEIDVLTGPASRDLSGGEFTVFEVCLTVTHDVGRSDQEELI